MSLSFGPTALSTPPADVDSVKVTNRDTNEPADLSSPVEVDASGRVSFTVAEGGRYMVTTTNGPVSSSRKVTLLDADSDKDAPVVLNAEGENLGLADPRAATDEHREPALQGHRDPSGIEAQELEAQHAAAVVSERPEATPAEEADKVEEAPQTEDEKARLEETEAKSDENAPDPVEESKSDDVVVEEKAEAKPAAKRTTKKAANKDANTES